LTSASIFSHGDVAQLQIGNSNLGTSSLPEYQDCFQKWKSALTPNADILLYGCNIAQGETGEAFVNKLSDLTGFHVSASTNLTGAASEGGDWKLEYGTGKIDTAAAIGSIDSYKGLLGTTFLSDLTPTSATNGWGPVERDRSNGEAAANDGKTIRLNGIAYSKGLGLHSGADLTYKLGGNYARFTSDIGIDDEVGNRGSVVFQVWTDGAKLYDSGIMTGGSNTKRIDLDVTGKQNLRLIVLDGGDNTWYDHADWANAQLTTPPDKKPPTSTLTAAPINTSISTPYTFTVTYRDDTAVNASTINSNDIQVTGPKGFSQLAQLKSLTPNTNNSR
jgi:NPCBM/NEW2 domain/Domain of unknown function (DUF4347)